MNNTWKILVNVNDVWVDHNTPEVFYTEEGAWDWAYKHDWQGQRVMVYYDEEPKEEYLD